ncbi:MAG: hypothetical protein JWP72_1613 [Massilia sp.]|nr:hypothetical protein [Massilia sp.]
MHSLAIPIWGLTVLSLFLTQSYAFFRMYESGFRRAWLVISLAHAMHNAFAMALLSLD